jgi:predicted DsbA family dithiol-disulfide isomerase
LRLYLPDQAAMSALIALEVFSDYVCPWCYLGNAVVEKLQQQHPLKLTRTPFPLHPTTPQEGLLLSELLRGVDLDAIHQRLYALMHELGLPYGKRDKTYNSRLAQELGMWADTQPGGDALHGLLFRRYFVQNQNLAETEVLLSVVEEAGLDGEAARQVLQERSFRDAVDEAWLRARGFQITGVPTFVAAGYQISGFQPLDEMQRFVQFVQEKTTR